MYFLKKRSIIFKSNWIEYLRWSLEKEFHHKTATMPKYDFLSMKILSFMQKVKCRFYLNFFVKWCLNAQKSETTDWLTFDAESIFAFAFDHLSQ